jgi:hypothetical protein
MAPIVIPGVGECLGNDTDDPEIGDLYFSVIADQ